MNKEIPIQSKSFSLNIMGKQSIIQAKQVYVKGVSITKWHYYQDDIEISESDYIKLENEYKIELIQE